MIPAIQILILLFSALFLTGCGKNKEEKPIWEQVKVGDIAPSDNLQSASTSLQTINFDVYVFEIPDENVSKLKKIWGMLYSKPLRFTNPEVFNANLFCVRFGQIQIWNQVRDMLVLLNAQKIVTISVMLISGQTSDIAVTGLNESQSVSYIFTDGSRQKATIGPGIVVLRLKAEKIPDMRGRCKLIANPVFTLPISGTIPTLAARTKAREFYFNSVAFALEMSPGDFVILGPKKYTSDVTTLSGLFFNNPKGRLFFDEYELKTPERKSTVRIFLIVCTNIID
jgi:hypothetical protein